ncbi:MAG TPA: cyanophycin synthetase, partial [Spirochaetota bacterium]
PDNDKISESFSALKIPGRMEILSVQPIILFDPAHNEQAIRSLAKTIKDLYTDNPITLFISMMKDKNPEALIPVISDLITPDIYYLTLDDPRAYNPLQDNNLSGRLSASDSEAILSVLNKRDDTIHIFTGSFRLYQTAKEISRFFIDADESCESRIRRI